MPSTTRQVVLRRVVGLAVLALLATAMAPVGWGWLPAAVAWGWAIRRSPWPGDLLDRAVPVALVAAAALQTLGWITPWLPGRNGPWWLVIVVSPFVLRRGATVRERPVTWRTAAYVAAGVVPAVATCWPWLVSEPARRLDYFGWGGDFAIHAETLRDVLVAGGSSAALDPPTGFGGYPSSVQVLWGWLMGSFGVSGEVSPAGLVAALAAAATVTYLSLGLALAWTMRRVLELLPNPGRRTRDLVGLIVIVVSLVCWPFPAILTSGFAPYPAAVALVVVVVGLLADADTRPVVLVAAAATVVVMAGAFPLLLVLPLVGLVVAWWRLGDRIRPSAVVAVVAVTAGASVVCLPSMIGLPDIVGLCRQRGVVPVLVVVVTSSLMIGALAGVLTRWRLATAHRPKTPAGPLRSWIGITLAIAVLVLGFSAAWAAFAEGGDILYLPLWLVLPILAVLVAGWSTPAIRDALRPLSPVVAAVLASSTALAIVGLRVTGGIPYYVEKSLYASFGALLPIATAAMVFLASGRSSPWAKPSTAVRPLATAVVAAVCVGLLAVSVPRQGAPLSVRGWVLWWTSGAGKQYLVDGSALLSVADRTVERAGGPGSPDLGPGRATSPPMSGEAWSGLDEFGVGSWYISQRWVWALSSTYREDVYGVARRWWQANKGGPPGVSLAAVLRRWDEDDPARRITLLVPDDPAAEALRRSLRADGIDGASVVVGPTSPGVPLAREAPDGG